jgi:hypothetical protein
MHGEIYQDQKYTIFNLIFYLKLEIILIANNQKEMLKIPKSYLIMIKKIKANNFYCKELLCI